MVKNRIGMTAGRPASLNRRWHVDGPAYRFRSSQRRAPTVEKLAFQFVNAVHASGGEHAVWKFVWHKLANMIVIAEPDASLCEKAGIRGPADAHDDTVAR